MEPQFTYITVDDEKATHLILDHFLKEYPILLKREQFSDPVMALNFINEQGCDLVFLDIDMPYLNGFELLDQMKNKPLVIMITAHAQKFALNGYQYIDKGVIDFLEKPVEKERLDKAIQRFIKYKQELYENINIDYILSESSNATIQVQKKDKWVTIESKDIKCLSVSGNYVFFNTIDGEHYSKYCSLEDAINSLPVDLFIQVNRQQVVNIIQIQFYNKDTINLGEDQLGNEMLIPISVRRRHEVIEQIEAIKKKVRSKK